MKLAHKALVMVVYHKAVCHHEGPSSYAVYDKQGGRKISGGPSAWNAWSNAYHNLSTALKRKAQQSV